MARPLQLATLAPRRLCLGALASLGVLHIIDHSHVQPGERQESAGCGVADNIAGRFVDLCPEPIDVVYTWVNGSDPRWLADMAKWKEIEGVSVRSGNASEGTDAASANRFRDSGELRYSLRSLFKYAPWVRQVFLVTNGQVPVWLDTSHPRLHVIPHSAIFPDPALLPVFASPAIELNLHRIPGLSKRFVYFNDDVLLGAPVRPEDFYSPSTGQRVYLDWQVPKCAKGCVDSWLGDGFCDTACNTTTCQFDGGDCTNSTIRTRHSGLPGSSANAPCMPGCPSTWVADRMCDTRCNVPSCAYDAGDCGVAAMYTGVSGSAAKVQLHESQQASSKSAWAALQNFVQSVQPADTATGTPPSDQAPAEQITQGQSDLQLQVRLQVLPVIEPESVVPGAAPKACLQLAAACSHDTQTCRKAAWRAAQGAVPGMHGDGTVPMEIQVTFQAHSMALGGEGFLVVGEAGSLPLEAALYVNISAAAGAARTYGVVSVAAGIALQRAWESGGQGSCAARTQAAIAVCHTITEEGVAPSASQTAVLDEWVKECQDVEASISVPLQDLHWLSRSVSAKARTADRGDAQFVRRAAILALHDTAVVLIDPDRAPTALDAWSQRLRMSEQGIKAAARGDAAAHPQLAALADPIVVYSLPFWLRYGVMYRGPLMLRSEVLRCRGAGIRRSGQCSAASVEAMEEAALEVEIPLRVNLTDTLPVETASESSDPEESIDGSSLNAMAQEQGSRRLATRPESVVASRVAVPVVSLAPRSLRFHRVPRTLASRAHRAAQIQWLHRDRRPGREVATVWRALANAAHSTGQPTPPTDAQRRRLLDLYGESLVFTNRLMNERFGINTRRVPAHMPHMASIDTMEALVATFPDAVNSTLHHRFRHGQDLQFAFAYFSFLAAGGAREGVNLEQYWRDELDTDGSGRLEWNELRTLAAVVAGGPPTTDGMRELLGCLFPGYTLPQDLRADAVEVQVPAASLANLLACAAAMQGLREHARFPPQSSEGDIGEVGFRMISDDFNTTLKALDELRGAKPKFICVNDDMQKAPADTQAALAAFLQALAPQPCPFELPHGRENPEPLYMDEQR